MLVAVGMVCVASGLNFSTAAATGESTTAVLTSPLTGTSTTFTWSYEFHANGGHELSNIAIAFCSTDILAHVVSASPSGEAFLVGDVPGGHTGFGPGMKFGTAAVSGTLTVVFDQPYPAGGSVQIQSHSGDGQTGDLVTSASGPGNCNPTTTTTVPPTTTTLPSTTTTRPPATTPGPSTTTTTAPTTTTTLPSTTTTAPPTTTTLPSTTTTAPPTTTTLPATTTTAPPTTTTLPATTTTVPVTRTVPPTTVPPATTTRPPSTTTLAPTTSTSVPTSVLGARFESGDPSADLAGTGFTGGPLVALGAVAILLGAALVVGSRLQALGE